MNAGVVSSILTCTFLLFIILGFLFGLWRGFSKSLVRLLIVVIVAVATFFVVPSLTRTILSADLSSLSLTVGDVTVKTLEEFLTSYLSEIELVKELMNSSQTFTEFIQVVPTILVNLVLFILFFFLVKMLSMIIYWIINAIFFSKKKMEGKNKHRFIGAVIGSIQGILVALVVLMPVFGILNLSNNAQTALSESKAEVQQIQSGESSTPPETIFYVDENTDNQEEPSIDDALKEVQAYTKALESNFIYKTLNTIGLVKLSNSVFSELTTIEVETETGKKEYKFTEEAIEISRMYPYIELVMNTEFDVQDNEFIDKIILLIDKSYSSPLLSDIVTEVIKEAATIWSDTSIAREERVFLGMATPDLGSEDMNAILDEQLNSIKNANKEQLKTKLTDVLKIAKVANDTIKLTEEIKDSLADVSVENLENIFNAVVENETVKDVIKDVVTTDNLDSLGIKDVGTQTLIVDVVTEIVDADSAEVKKEVVAIKEVFTLSEKINEAQDYNTTVNLESTEVESLIDGLANSTIITNLIKEKQNEETVEGVANPIKNLDISNTLSEETKTALESQINEKITDETLKSTLEQILLGKTQEQ